ncbi:MAG TPA: hypothetical protein VMF14_15580 [Solirubrobacteraceae bacterium]|nr:hypothetical protein [Solirubrobacteraceae bacterium]
MPTLDNLPGEQRAVLEMVLKHGRSYDQIATLLKLDRAKVRERAQIALDSIGPHTEVAPEHQHRIADYLLGQLPEGEVPEVRDLLADSPTDRAWARVVASELAPLTAGRPLPEIPVERSASREPDSPGAPELTAPQPSASAPIAGLGPANAEDEPKRRWGRRRRQGAEPTPAPAPAEEPATPVSEPAVAASRPAAPASPPGGPSEPPEAETRRSSRLGGALVLLAGVIVVAAVLFFVLRGGHSKHSGSAGTSTAAPAASASATSTASTASSPTGSTPTTSTSGTSASVVAQINLSPPSSAKGSKMAGIAEVLNEGTSDGVAIVAQNVPPNKSKPRPDAYAVWLYNSAKDAKLLGFVNPSVGKNGRLSTAGGLPTNAKHYKELIVTLETTAKPKQPGSIVLQGAMTGL